MHSLAAELKQAREQKRLSLADIADATLINVRFLQEIESGNFTFLPQTYVRAFLREYAAMVGLSPEAVLRTYEGSVASTPETPVAPATPVTDAPPPAPAPVSTPIPRAEGRRIHPTMALVALVSIVVLVVVVALWNVMDSNTPAAVREIPFDQVRAERERDAAADSGAVRAPALPPAPADSLVLTAVATDSVWLQLTVDKAPVRNLLLKSGGRYTWRAAGRFLLTLGNAGAVEFTLNRKPLGKLGKPGAVVKNIELTHATLSRK
jgi:transcriptional regulator with XRE-family HTH domain